MNRSLILALAGAAALTLGALSAPMVASEARLAFARRAPVTVRLSDAELTMGEQPSSGTEALVFDPSYDFPAAFPNEPQPWKKVDFKKEPEKYLRSVLAYVMEGQSVDTWDVEENPVRRWYHMPWLGPGRSGREFTHGLTAEIAAQKHQLGPKQESCRQTWAIGFYNPVGGYTLGKIWRPVIEGKGRPNLKPLPFNEGTVVAKLLYTEAKVEEVPQLDGAPELWARIVKDELPDDNECPSKGDDASPAPRDLAQLRLLQFDVAVRDARAAPTGWVFGTFVYDKKMPGKPWEKLRPLGLMWGVDKDLTDADAAAGKTPRQSKVLNLFQPGVPLGRAGRLNGPLDNNKSACISCHMTAEYPQVGDMAPPKGATWPLAKCWFRNLKGIQEFGASPKTEAEDCPASAEYRHVALDYSLQLAAALQKYDTLHPRRPKPGSPHYTFVPKGPNDVRIYPVTRDPNE